MGEVFSILTGTRVTPSSFRHFKSLYYKLLQKTGSVTPAVLEWLVSTRWPSWEGGYSTDYPYVNMVFENECFPVRPYFSVDAGENDWLESIQLGFFFEIELFHEPQQLPFKPAGAHLIWFLLQQIASVFPEKGVYATNEAQVYHPLEALEDITVDFWSFEAALVPKGNPYVSQSIPSIFAQKDEHDFLGLARKDLFPILPWQQEE
jgi:hypothetical protein